MKHFQFIISVTLVITGLFLGTADTYAQNIASTEKLTVGDLFKAQVKNHRLAPRQQSLSLMQPVRKSTGVSSLSSSQGTYPTIYASMINRSTWGSTMQYGIYSFTPGEYSFELIKKNVNFNANGGASYIGDNNYLTIGTTDFGGGLLWIEMHAYSTDTWNEVYNCTGDQTVLATDMTYCAADNKVYGCFDNGSSTGYVFGRFDQDTFDRTKIVDLDEAWIACSSDAAGTIYAVTVSGKLITADKQTGAINEIGNTGLKSDNLTSGAIDPSTNIFYIATCNDDGSAFYSVDLATAQAQLIYDMPDGEELVGMYVATPALDPDVPAAVTDLSAEFAENSLSGTVSFTLPATNAGGAQGSGTLSYTISAEDNTLASGSGTYGQAVSVPVTFQRPGNYEISVAVSNSSGTGPVAVTSVSVSSIDYDNILVLPYNETFSSQSGFDSFTVIDANGDASTWVYWANRGCALCQFSATNASDDYFVTRPVLLEKDKVYILTCDLSRRGAPYKEAYEFVMGKAATPQSLTTVLLSKQLIDDNDIHHETITIVPTETAVYYIAVHCLSPADAYGLCVDNFTLSEGAYCNAPASPSITVQPDFGGATQASITVYVPSVDFNGNSLSEIKSVTLCRDDKEIKQFDNPTPGQILTYVDIPENDGYHTYSAYATNDAGNGHSTSVKAFVGINYPAPPTDVTIKELTETPGMVTMKWNAPEIDSDGNPINPELVTYMIAHRMNGANLSIVQRGIKGTEYTFRALDPENEEQKFVTYLIFSETARGVNDWTVTQTAPIVVGNPFEMPYKETFGSENLSPLLTTTSNTNAIWKISNDITDQDGDGKYLAYNALTGSTGTLTTARINLSGESPVFSFWYMCIEEASDEIVVSVDAGNGFEEVGTFCIGDGDAYTWTKASVPLSDYIGKTVQIKLSYTAVAYRLAIDNICVENPVGFNLSVRGISVPYVAHPGVPFEVRLYVTNNGLQNPGQFSSDLYRDGIKVATVMTEGLEPFQSTTVRFSDVLPAMANNPTEYFASVNCTGDTDTGDNVTGGITIEVEQLDYPAPTSLKAEGNGSMVCLSWDEIVIPRDNITLTDGFEDLLAFSTGLENSELYKDNIGDWTSIHADGGQCYVMQVGGTYLRFPNANSNTGFIVFNAEEAGVPEKVIDIWRGHDGSAQCFLAYATIGVPNDKWLVSPLLSENAQQISFYAKSAIDTYGLESFEVLYSTTGKDIADFTKVGEVKAAVPTQWTEYTYQLPAGAKYFAIRSTSNDVYALLVDDVKFEKAHPHRSLEFVGYRVYRDADILTSEPVGGTDHYISEYPDGRTHVYNVTALYTTGESAPSNDASYTTSSIDGVAVSQPIIESGHGFVAVRNAVGESLRINGVDGVVYYNDIVDSDIRVSLLPGVYIVYLGSKVMKLVVS
jgi:cleaved adhesin domain protein